MSTHETQFKWRPTPPVPEDPRVTALLEQAKKFAGGIIGKQQLDAVSALQAEIADLRLADRFRHRDNSTMNNYDPPAGGQRILPDGQTEERARASMNSEAREILDAMVILNGRLRDLRIRMAVSAMEEE